MNKIDCRQKVLAKKKVQSQENYQNVTKKTEKRPKKYPKPEMEENKCQECKNQNSIFIE